MTEWTVNLETSRLGDNDQLEQLLLGVARHAEDALAVHAPTPGLHDGCLGVTLTVDAGTANEALNGGMDALAVILAGIGERGEWPDGVEAVGADALVCRVEIEAIT